MRGFCAFCSRVSVRRAIREFQTPPYNGSHSETATAVVPRKEPAR